MRVLDVATGPGGVAVRAAARGAVVSGVDLAPRMIALAAQRAPQLEFRVADVKRSRLRRPRLRPWSVISVWAISPGPRGHWRNVCGCSSPGQAELLLVGYPRTDADPRGVDGGHEEVGAAPPPDLPAGPPLFQFAAADAFAALLAAAGLQEVAIQGHAYTHWSRCPRPGCAVPWGVWHAPRPPFTCRTPRRSSDPAGV